MKNSSAKLKILGFYIVILIFAFSIFNFVNAADSPALIDLNSYPWSNAKTPASFVAVLYQISLGLAAAAALGAMLYGAILHTVSGGNASRQDEARKWITGAIWGLVLLLGAYIILYTINPGLVKLTDPSLGKVDIPPVPEGPQPQPAQAGITPQGVQMATSRPEAINAAIQVKDGACSDQGINTNCRLDANLNIRLINLNSSVKADGISWRVTEAWPPAGSHISGCHANGTCLDANFTEKTQPTADNVNKFIAAARSSGLQAVYEVSSQADFNKWLSAGVPASSLYLNKTTNYTGPHFHVNNTYQK